MVNGVQLPLCIHNNVTDENNRVRVQFPSRNYLIQALFWGSIIFFCLYLTHIAQLKLSTYSTPSVYIIDDFTDEAGSEAHGLQVYNLIYKNLPEGFADIYCVNISLGKSSSVDELNNQLENLLKQNVDLINMSFGMNFYNQSTYDLLKQLSDRGTIIIAAAGNSGNDFCQYPAAYDLECIISIGAAELNGQISSYSNYGQEVDVFVKTPNTSTNFSGTSAACAIFTNSILKEKVLLNRDAINEHIIEFSELIKKGDHNYYFYVPD